MQDTSALEALEQAVLVARAGREELELSVRDVPSWRFRRRRALERAARRRRQREELLQEALLDAAPQPDTRLTG